MDTAKGYSGFWKRFVAYVIDVIIVYLIVWVLGMFMPDSPTQVTVQGASSSADTNLGLVGVAVAWLYFALQESSARRATFSKRALGIVVTDLDGKKIDFGRATVRHFSKIISGVILGIGYIMASFTQKKQGLHDMIAGTLVINA